MANDLIHLAMCRAADRYGGNSGVFNGAGFSHALIHFAKTNRQLDGEVVAVILCGRDDVDCLAGGSHYRIHEEVSDE